MNCSISKVNKQQLNSFLGLHFFFKARNNFDGHLNGLESDTTNNTLNKPISAK